MLPMFCKRFGNRDGSALVAVLFLLLVLAALAARLAGETRSDLGLGFNQGRQLKNDLVLEGAINAAIFTLSNPSGPSLIADGRSFTMVVLGKPVQIAIQNELGKVNINSAQPVLLQKLLDSACVSPDDINRTITALNAMRKSPNGDITALAKATPTALGKLEQLKELTPITAEALDRLRTYVSVYNFRDEPDAGLSPAKLKTLLGMAQSAGDGGLRPTLSANGITGIYSIEVGDIGQPARQTAIVYLTGDRRKPYRILSWSQNVGADAEVRCD